MGALKGFVRLFSRRHGEIKVRCSRWQHYPQAKAAPRPWPYPEQSSARAWPCNAAKFVTLDDGFNYGGVENERDRGEAAEHERHLARSGDSRGQLFAMRDVRQSSHCLRS